MKLNKIGFSNINLNKNALITIGAILAAIIMVIVGVNSVTANAIAYEEKVTEAKSAISVQEKKRANLFPELVECVKNYDRHEYETLLAVINARAGENAPITDDIVNEVNNILEVVVEKYPDLSSQPNYERLMTNITMTENEIAEARDTYNTAVSRYNSYTRPPLRKFFLSLTGYEKIEFEKLSYDVSDDGPISLFNER